MSYTMNQAITFLTLLSLAISVSATETNSAAKPNFLIIGVDDDKNIVGLEKDFQTLKKPDADYYEVHLRNIMHKLMGVKYVSKYIRTQFEKLEDGNWVCKIKVIPAKEPLYLKYKNKNGQLDEKFYVRSGNSSHEIETIAEINDYINSKFK